MSATRTAQAFPGSQQLAAALGVVLAIALILVFVFGVLATPKAAVTATAAGAAQPTWDHGASSDASNVSIVVPATFDHGASSDASNVSIGSSEPGGSNRLRLPK